MHMYEGSNKQQQSEKKRTQCPSISCPEECTRMKWTILHSVFETEMIIIKAQRDYLQV